MVKRHWPPVFFMITIPRGSSLFMTKMIGAVESKRKVGRWVSALCSTPLSRRGEVAALHLESSMCQPAPRERGGQLCLASACERCSCCGFRCNKWTRLMPLCNVPPRLQLSFPHPRRTLPHRARALQHLGTCRPLQPTGLVWCQLRWIIFLDLISVGLCGPVAFGFTTPCPF